MRRTVQHNFSRSPWLLKKLSPFAYTTLTNLVLWLGVPFHGLGHALGFPAAGLVWGIALLAPGVNGGSAHAAKALCGSIAVQEGYGRGEFSAWQMNLRGIAVTIATVLYGRWYGACLERGDPRLHGTVWYFAGFLGGLLPQLIAWSMPKRSYQRAGVKTSPDRRQAAGGKYLLPPKRELAVGPRPRSSPRWAAIAPNPHAEP